MHRGSWSSVIFLASWFYVFASFHRLWRARLYAKFLLTLAVFSCLGLFIYLGFVWAYSLQSGDLRVWAVTPFICLALAYVLSGFFLRHYVERCITPTACERVSPSTAVRSVGAVPTFAGITIWLYGIVLPITGTRFIVALIVSLYCMLLGFPDLIAGKRISDMDS